MASEQQLRAIISVLDKTREPLAQINARFAAMSEPLRRIGDRIAGIAEETGLKEIGARAGEALEHVKRLGEGLFALAGPLAALGAAGSVAGLVEIAHSTAEYGEQMRLAAIATGMSTEQLAGWQYAAKLANIDADQMTKGLQYLNRNIAEAAMGRAKPVEQLFAAMGLHNAPGNLVSTQQALHAVAAEVQQLVGSGNIQLATDLVGQLFGQRSGMALLPIFKEGPAAIDAALAEAGRHGLAISDAQAEAGQRFMDSFKGMEAAVDGLRYAIGSRLFPVLTPVVERMTSWLDANRAWLATRIDRVVSSLADALGKVDWAGIIGGFKSVIEWAGWFVEDVVGVKWALIGMVAVSLSPMVLAFSRLGFVVGEAAVKFALFPAAEFLYTLATLVPTIGSVADAMAALNLVLDANPIGAVVLAVGALIAVGYELYSHWQQIEALWQGLPEPVKAMVEALGAVFAPFIAIPLELYEHWSRVVALFREAEGLVARVGHAVGIGGGATPLTRLPGGGPAGAAAQQSHAKIDVSFANAPPGTKIAAQTRGEPDLTIQAGYAFAGP